MTATAMFSKGISVVPASPGSHPISIDIVFLHGLNGSSNTTWTHPETDFQWPVELEKDLSNARIMFFDYNVDITPNHSSNNTRIKGIALNFLNQLANNRQEDNEINRPLILIGHSLGGLVIKHALTIAARDSGNDRGEIYQSVQGLLFFGTPNAGSLADQKKRMKILKNMAKVVFVAAPPKIQSALEMHSDELADLADEFRKIDVYTSTKISIYSFFETLDNKLLGERVVDEFSSRVNAPREEILPIDADHINMVKFRDEQDEIYKNILATTRRIRRRYEKSASKLHLPDPKDLGISHGWGTTESEDLTNSLPPGDDHRSQNKRHFSIPKERKISTFVGREDILCNISDHFERVIDLKEVLKLCLTGMGGIGKSQVALEYCCRAYSTGQFRTIFWIDAFSEDTVLASFGRIAKVLNLQVHGHATARDNAQNVLAALQSHHNPFLLVYDNYDDPHFDQILSYAPISGPGALLFTSRLRSSALLLGAEIEVDVMHKDTARVLLELRSGYKTVQGSPERIEAEKAVKLLHGLPLAIDQAGAYIRVSRNGDPFKTFIAHYHSRRKKILTYLPKIWQYKKITDRTEEARRVSVYTTWELSLNLLGCGEIDNRRKTRFFTLAAFLGGPRVSKDFFEHYCARHTTTSEADKDWISIFRADSAFDTSSFREVLAELADLSLIRGFTETLDDEIHFNIHPLVGDWARQRLGIAEQRAIACEVRQLLRDFFDAFTDEMDPDLDLFKTAILISPEESEMQGPGAITGHLTEELLSHVTTCINICEEIGLELDHESCLVNTYFVSFLAHRGSVRGALKLFEKVLKMLLAFPGSDNDFVCKCIRAVLCQLWQDVKLLEILIVARQGVTSQISNVGDQVHHLEALLPSSLVGAYMMHRERGNTVRFLCVLIHIFLTSGQQSEEMWLWALVQGAPFSVHHEHLEAFERLLDREFSILPDPSESWRLYQSIHLARCKLSIARGRYSDAEDTLRRYKAAAITQMGSEVHPSVLVGDWALSDYYTLQGNWQAAEPLMRPYYEYITRAMGFNNPVSREVVFRMCFCWMKMGPKEMDHADLALMNMIQTYTETYGPHSLHLFIIQMRSYSLYMDAGHFEAAMKYISGARRGYCSRLDTLCYARVATEYRCAEALLCWKARPASDVESVIQEWQSRLARLEAKYGKDREITMDCRAQFGIWLYGVSYLHQALPVVEETVHLLGNQSDRVWELDRPLYFVLGVCYSHAMRYAEAISLLREVLQGWEEQYGREHAMVMGVVRELAVALRKDGQCDAALEQEARLTEYANRDTENIDEAAVAAGQA